MSKENTPSHSSNHPEEASPPTDKVRCKWVPFTFVVGFIVAQGFGLAFALAVYNIGSKSAYDDAVRTIGSPENTTYQWALLSVILYSYLAMMLRAIRVQFEFPVGLFKSKNFFRTTGR